MPASIAILIPSLRKDRWDQVKQNAEDNTPGKVYFAAEEYPSYATAINGLFTKTTEPYVFCGADDLEFTPNWSDAALSLMRGDIRVVGTNDLHHPGVLEGEHATHYLVDRRYIEQVGGTFEEEPGKLLHEYLHNWCDTEFIETARCREVYAHAHDAIVEHKHHRWTEGVEIDPTYQKANDTFDEDLRTFQNRRTQWLSKYGPPE